MIVDLTLSEVNFLIEEVGSKLDSYVPVHVRHTLEALYNKLVYTRRTAVPGGPEDIE